MTNREISLLLRKVSAAFEVKDENFFRVRAYQNAAASIEHATSDLHDLWEENKLGQIPGVGPNLAQHLDELFRTGGVRHFENETKDLPQGMFEILGIPGIGAKTAYKLAKAFKLTDPKTARLKLAQVAKKGLIRDLDGFGEQSEKEILNALSNQRLEERMLLPQAQLLAEEVMEYLSQEKAVEKVEVLGSLRRKVATIGDVDLAVATSRPKQVMEHLLKFTGIKKVLSTGPKTTMFVHTSGHQVDVKTQDPAAWGSMLQHYTGSKLHNIHLRTYALEKKMSLSEHGVKYKGKLNKFRSEEEFYRYLGLKWIPPEIREDMGEIEMAKKDTLPILIETSDIKGDLHIHSNVEIATSHDSGRSSIKELLETATQLGYEYIGITDHNPKSSLSVVGKLEVIKARTEAIEKQRDSVENSVKTRVPKVFVGLEVDIRPNGELALSDTGLDILDYAIASVHSVFNQSKEEATRRVLAALAHPKVKIFGHPSGRLLGKRWGLDYDWDKVFDFCAKNDKWLEVNSSAQRLDLPDTLIRDGLKYGIKLIINTDSHHSDHMSFMTLGISNARRGFCEKKNVVNTLSLKDFEEELKKH